MLTVVLAVGELAYPPPAGWGCTFEVSAVVLPPPQAATANELTATTRMAYASLIGLIRDIYCSFHCWLCGRWWCACGNMSTTFELTLVAAA
jgi:hypothetical protein